MTIDPDAPWYVNITVLILILGVMPILTAWFSARANKKRIETMASDVLATKAEVKNTHTKNLREDLDDQFNALHVRLDKQEEWNKLFSQADRDIENTGNLRNAATERQLTIAVADRNARIDDLITTKIPQLIKAELAKHLESCPFPKQGAQSPIQH